MWLPWTLQRLLFKQHRKDSAGGPISPQFLEPIETQLAATTLLVLDACLPGGVIEGAGNMRYAQTMAFTTLMFSQMFNAFSSRSDEQSAFAYLFRNHWLYLAVGISIALHVAVIYVPGMQEAFSTVPISFADWLLWAGAGSFVLWFREFSKLVAHRFGRA